YCGASLTAADRYCGSCGAPVPAATPAIAPRVRPPWAMIAIGGAVLALGALSVAVFAVLASPSTPTAEPAAPSEAPSVESPTPTVEPVPAPTPEPVFAGTWAGDILGDSHPYSVQATISDDGGIITGTAVYPEIPCQG